tara:strand:+ start:161 stop:391 length:231 start_codon:yes stop_codon:yes gene_type:complete
MNHATFLNLKERELWIGIIIRWSRWNLSRLHEEYYEIISQDLLDIKDCIGGEENFGSGTGINGEFYEKTRSERKHC